MENKTFASKPTTSTQTYPTMSFDDSSERKKLVEDLEMIEDRLAKEDLRLDIKTAILAIYTKRATMILDTLRDAKERRLSACEAKGLLYLTYLKTIDAIAPMIENLSRCSQVPWLLRIMFSQYVRRTVEIGQEWTGADGSK
jgi:hypothetical protein